MADFTPEIASEILSACQSGGEEAARALGRALDREFSFAAGEVSTVSGDSMPDTWNGPGLVVTFHIGDSGALLLLPESSELLPDWCAEPDETGRSKLATLARELGCVILPEGFAPDEVSAARVKDLAGAFLRAEPAGDVGYLPLTLTSGDKSGEAALVWPVHSTAKTLEEPVAESADAASTAGASASVTDSTRKERDAAEPAAEHSVPKTRIHYADIDDGIRQLPNYARSLLKVRIPVIVTLASAKYPVSQILELCPGSIIQFNKSCEDNLTLEVGNQAIAAGEAVKIGDKFGLWITSMTMPDERFWVIHGRRSGARVK
ncbi:MAG TPA: FliM/FliN family flagellar motor C-terminal domain-containing protein [Pirellulaceae bacterium]|nr:FliM/FliN family flagellar motor C-terminal domain-containing protein [Pirellulaceae bacterium]